MMMVVKMERLRSLVPRRGDRISMAREDLIDVAKVDEVRVVAEGLKGELFEQRFQIEKVLGVDEMGGVTI